MLLILTETTLCNIMQIFSVGGKWKLVDASEKRPMNLWSCKEMRNLHPGSLITFSLRYC